METIKMSNNAYKMHSIVCTHVRKINSITAEKLAAELGLSGKITTAKRNIRKIKKEVNSIDSPFLKKILSWRGGYYVAEEGESREETIAQYREYIESRKKTAFSILVGTYQMEQHSLLEGQTRLPLSEYMKTIVEIGVARADSSAK